MYIEPSLVASSLAFAFSNLAIQATDLGPRTLPSQVEADLTISVTVIGPAAYQGTLVLWVNLC